MISDWISGNSNAVRGTAIIVLGLVALYIFISRVARRVIARIASTDDDAGRRAKTLWSMLRRLVYLILAVTGSLALLNQWGVSITAFVAVGSAIGLALGFGAQNLVRDVISGFFILAEDQFKIGDVVRIAGVTGAVEEIRPRVTVLRDNEGNVHYVPNGEIAVASNLTQEFAQVVIDVRVSHRDSIDRAMEVLGDELRALAADADWVERVIETPVVLGVDALNPSEVVLRATMKVAAEDRWLLKREALGRIKRRFDREGISMPLPQIEVHDSET